MGEILMPGFILELKKKRGQKASAMRNERALAVGSRRWLMFCLVCWLSYRRLKLIWLNRVTECTSE
jgi:hypothetical protein